MKNDQENFWAKEYAQDYIKKNSQFDKENGVKAWEIMLSKAEGINSLLECGCNIGRNINFLEEVLPKSKKSIIELSQPAFNFVTNQYNFEHAYHGSILESDFNQKFNLVYSMGVLIHIHPDNLISNMAKMYDYSNEYILIGEYFNRTPVMLEYQGQKDKLFKCDFGKIFMENFPVELVDYGFLWGKIYDASGFDDITWWLFKKTN